MRKETYVFLILILSAAITTGSTAGIITNIKYVKTHLSAMSADNKLASESEADPHNSATAPSTSRSSPNRQVEVAAAQAGTSSGSTDSESLNMSADEQSQVKDMLVNLGMQNADYAQLIMQYQQAHGINPTGNLDSNTLNSIVQEITLERARQLATQQ